jgi:uncharacterized membrane protein YhaH (DUF805 family)
MKKPKSRDEFWLVLGTLNVLAMVYPTSLYLRAASTEDQILGLAVLIGLGLLLAIIDTVSVMVAYLQ